MNKVERVGMIPEEEGRRQTEETEEPSKKRQRIVNETKVPVELTGTKIYSVSLKKETQYETKKDISEERKAPMELREAPVYRPTAEEFRNPIQWIRKMHKEMMEYGIVKVIPPRGWNPPSPMSRLNLSVKFSTYKQRVHGLNSRDENKISEGARYTPLEYRKMALMFENEWRERNPDKNTIKDVENFFWKTVERMEPPIHVEYGANLSPTDVGSGFTLNEEIDKTLGSYDQWNLNTIGYVPEGSLLGLQCKGNISGITQPWIYFGMLFASFAWHVEDNHLFSINYMHQGAAKSWYGVPAVAADGFDSVCEDIHGRSKSLLRRLNLLVPPKQFLERGVQITHSLQEPGQFIITCPRAYHAGFSQGFNVGEAVNFATFEWIPRGITCREMYHAPVMSSDEFRHSVFNVDSLFYRIVRLLVSKDMAFWRANCTKAIVQGLCGQLRVLSENDRVNRRILLSGGAQEHKMECAVNDEEHRECKYCKASAFTSVLICPCQWDKTVCLKHRDRLCKSCAVKDMVILTWVTTEELDETIRVFERMIDEFLNPRATAL